MKNKPLITGLIAAASLAITACGPQAGEYPTKEVNLLVGFAAGGHNDVVARQFAEGLQDELGERVLVVNREGGGGSIAATEAVNAAADGYTLLFAPTGAFTSGILQQDVDYEIQDFRSIVPAAENPFVVTVPADSPHETFEDLQDADGRLTYANFGEGNPTHLIGAAIADEYDLEAEAVAYPGSPPALQAIVNGDVDFGVQDITSLIPRIESGEARALAVTTEYVPEVLGDDVPSLSEFGLDEYLFGGSQALAVPADTPEEVVERLREASEVVVESEEFQDFITNSGGIIPDVGGEEWFQEFMPSELDRFRTLYEEFGIGEQ